MKEYKIKLSNGDVFYRDDDGLCYFSEKIVVNESDAIEELAEEVVRLNAGIERLRTENKEYKGKYERFYSRFCEANSKLYDSNTDNERLKRENTVAASNCRRAASGIIPRNDRGYLQSID
ncbi:hypothetical protein [Bacillus sp. SB47]|uniref:hypothetical protein n=1 Tax=Bacillus sp. SB47 TaxID=1071079 RepID=UPI00047E88A1|nr:hypothetical protein [Bacillus sp. SB47]